MEMLANSPIADRLKAFNELHIDFLAAESRFFTFNRTQTIPALYYPRLGGDKRIKELAITAHQIISLCVTLGEYPYIRFVAGSARTAELAQLVEDMIETMYDAKGIGLAATQVNVHKRLLVLDVSEAQDTPREYINPEILETAGTETCEEGCLSVPGIYADVTRAEGVKVSAFDRKGNAFEETLDGMHAVCLQHEMDHFEGKLLADRINWLRRRKLNASLRRRAAAAQQSTKDQAEVPLP